MDDSYTTGVSNKKVMDNHVIQDAAQFIANRETTEVMISDMRKKSEEALKELKDRQSLTKDLQCELNNCKTTLEKNKRTHDYLLMSIHSTAALYASVDQDYGDVTEKLSELTRATEELTEKCSASESKYKEVNQEYDTLLQKFEKDKLQNEQQIMTAKAKRIQTENAVNARNISLKRRVDKLHKKLEASRDKTKILLEKKQDIIAKNKIKDSECLRLKSEHEKNIMKKKNELEMSKQKIQWWKNKVESAEEKAVHLQFVQDNLKSAEANKKTLTDKVEVLHKDVIQKEATKLQMETTRKTLEQETAQLQQDCGDLTQMATKSEDILHAEKANLAQLDNDRADMSKQLEAVRAQFDTAKLKMESEMKVQNQKLALMEQDFQQKESAVEQIKTEGAALKNKLTDTQLEKKQAQCEKTLLLNRIDNNKIKVVPKDKLDALSNELSSLKVQLSEKHTEKNLTQIRIDEMSTDIKRTEDDAISSETEYKTKEKQLRKESEDFEEQIKVKNEEHLKYAQIFKKKLEDIKCDLDLKFKELQGCLKETEKAVLNKQQNIENLKLEYEPKFREKDSKLAQAKQELAGIELLKNNLLAEKEKSTKTAETIILNLEEEARMIEEKISEEQPVLEQLLVQKATDEQRLKEHERRENLERVVPLEKYVRSVSASVIRQEKRIAAIKSGKMGMHEVADLLDNYPHQKGTSSNKSHSAQTPTKENKTPKKQTTTPVEQPIPKKMRTNSQQPKSPETHVKTESGKSPIQEVSLITIDSDDDVAPKPAQERRVHFQDPDANHPERESAKWPYHKQRRGYGGHGKVTTTQPAKQNNQPTECFQSPAGQMSASQVKMQSKSLGSQNAGTSKSQTARVSKK